MSVIKGTKDMSRMRASRVLKATGGTNKVRCSKCNELAVATPDGSGGVMHKCTGCSTIYRFKKI